VVRDAEEQARALVGVEGQRTINDSVTAKAKVFLKPERYTEFIRTTAYGK